MAKRLVILIDPDKRPDDGVLPYLDKFDYVFVGGSTAHSAAEMVRYIKQHTSTPVVLFPGSLSQFTPEADAILFLTLMNSRDSRLLIEQHIAAASVIHESSMKVVPMGYILIDGGTLSAVARTTSCSVLERGDSAGVCRLALTAELLGKQCVYLEAGSGALAPVPLQIIEDVRRTISLPIIVGGGIRTPEQVRAAWQAGADIVVIGNHFEEHPESIPYFFDD